MNLQVDRSGTESGSTVRATTLEEWVEERKASWCPDPASADAIARRALLWHPLQLGLSGTAVKRLVAGTPPMAPTRIWGGEPGWRGRKRKLTWERQIARVGGPMDRSHHGCLLRAAVDLGAWIPHPYAPPPWSLQDEHSFVGYYGSIPGILDLARRWHQENLDAINYRLAERLAGLPVIAGAGYTFARGDACIDIALCRLNDDSSVLEVAHSWKGQGALTALVRAVFPDAIAEYTEGWLAPQRLDVFVPSRALAFEYQGEQHFRAVEYFGGEKAFLANQERDRRKRAACRQAGVTIIEWHYNEPVRPDVLRRKLADAGITDVVVPPEAVENREDE